jgi:hypothetical protein
MDRSEQRAKEAHYIDGLPGMNGVPAFLGGMAGDPLSYLPTVFKLAASSAAIRAGRGVRAAEDITQLGFKRPQLGFMGDAVQQAAIQTAMVVGQAGFQHSIDPTASIDDYMGLFMIPMALGASVGLLTHSYVALGRQINKLRPGTPGDLGDIGAPANEPRPPPGGGGPAAVSRETTPTGDPTLDLLKPGGLKTDYAEVNAANRVRVRIVTETDRLMRDPTFEQGKSAMERLDKAKEAAEKSVELTNQDDQNAVASKAFVEAELAQKHKPPPSTVGANLLNQSLLDREKILAGNRFVKVKWLPDLPMNPVFRTAAGNSIAAQEIVEGLVESGGLTRVKNLEGEAPGVPSTERTIQMNWTPPLVEALRGQLTEWRKAREGGGYVEKNDMMSLAQVPIAAVKDWTGNTGELSFEAFRRRVGDVQNTGDHDMVGDKYSPHVDAAAAAIRKVYDKTGKEAMDSGLFQDSAEKTIAQRTARQQILTKELHDLEDKIDELKAHRDPVGNARYEKAQARMEELPGLIERTGQQIKTLSQQLDRLRSGNLDANETQTTYRPRVWLAGKIMNNAEAVKDIFRNYLKGGGLDGERLDRAVDDVFLTVTKQQPLYLRGDIDQLFQGVADPMSAHGITFRIPDALVKDYIENDSELLLRHHVRQMGAAIEMKKRWGSTDLADEIQQIRDEGERFKLDPKEIDQHIEDVTALRDRLYGTYGAAADPHRQGVFQSHHARHVGLQLAGRSDPAGAHRRLPGAPPVRPQELHRGSRPDHPQAGEPRDGEVRRRGRAVDVDALDVGGRLGRHVHEAHELRAGDEQDERHLLPRQRAEPR